MKLEDRKAIVRAWQKETIRATQALQAWGRTLKQWDSNAYREFEGCDFASALDALRVAGLGDWANAVRVSAGSQFAGAVGLDALARAVGAIDIADLRDNYADGWASCDNYYADAV